MTIRVESSMTDTLLLFLLSSMEDSTDLHQHRLHSMASQLLLPRCCWLPVLR